MRIPNAQSADSEGESTLPSAERDKLIEIPYSSTSQKQISISKKPRA